MQEDFKKLFKEKQEKVEKALDLWLPLEKSDPKIVHKAMRYSALAGGKRLRPVLCLAACEALGGNENEALPFACALELIHTYSLVHDDLPCMDNDDFRRGKPTNHKVFGEGMAVLAGDALLTLAFEWMTMENHVSPDLKVRVIQEIAQGSGTQGMVGGQVVDLHFQGKSVGPDELEYIHLNKTARLIQACVKSGALVGGGSESALKSISEYGRVLGLAFQITDDLLDVLGSAKKMGKAVGKDAQLAKATYPGLFGIETSKKMVKDLIEEGRKAIAFLGEKKFFLEQVLNLVEKREN